MADETFRRPDSCKPRSMPFVMLLTLLSCKPLKVCAEAFETLDSCNPRPPSAATDEMAPN